MEELVNYIGRYHFPIIGFEPHSKKEVVVGTCVIICIGERYFIVTASHVMNERQNVKDKELWLWNYSDGTKILITEDIVGNDALEVPHWHDVAIIEIDIKDYGSLDCTEFYDNCFLGVERIVLGLNAASAPGDELAYVISGFPASKNKILKGENKKPKLFLHMTLQAEGSASASIDDMLTISLAWDGKKLIEKGCALPAPQGMSGGGVWVISKESEYNPRLFAISVAHITSEQKVVAVKMSLVLAMLRAFFPGTLLDYIDLPVHVLGCDSSTKVAVLTHVYDAVAAQPSPPAGYASNIIDEC